MHLVTIKANDDLHPGVKLGDDILDLTVVGQFAPDLPGVPDSVRNILAGGAAVLANIQAILDRMASDSAFSVAIAAGGGLLNHGEVKYAAPLPDPRLIISSGRNSKLHAAELAIGNAPPAPERPSAFLKNPGAVIGPDESIILPSRYPGMVDWEAEFCAVIGRDCHNVSSSEAPDYIAGYTMINDVTARNFLPAPDASGKRTITVDAHELILLGKQLPTFCPMGPAIVTADEVSDPENINFALAVNGIEMQSGNSGDVFFSLAELVAYYSAFYRLQPGDIVTIGTPSGTGFSRSPQIFLKEGDRVTITCDVLGAFTNTVATQ